MSKSAATLYFHGIPGSRAELTLFGQWPKSNVAIPFVPERGSTVGEQDAVQYFEHMADKITVRYFGRKIRIIGFSLGACAALQVASRLGDQVTSIDLISAAAPLNTGNYLPNMAGRLVFELARKRPTAFRALVKMQSVMARLSPNILYDRIFATARGDDAVLKTNPDFKQAMLAIFGDCLVADTSAYRQEIGFYIQDWSAIPALVKQPVTLWHGNKDNWSPPDMAVALSRSLGGSTQINWIEGASHYSTLRAFFEQL